jgi:hypothetical protein
MIAIDLLLSPAPTSGGSPPEQEPTSLYVLAVVPDEPRLSTSLLARLLSESNYDAGYAE